MTTPISSSTRTVGFWSAVLATVFSLTYVVGQLAEWLGWLGSRGGPESSSTVLGIVVLLTPSLFLGSSFLVLLVSIHQLAAAERRVWSHSAVVFGTAYAVLISTVYFVQLTLVGPRLARGQVEGIEMFLFVPFDSFLYAVDILGYSFMSVRSGVLLVSIHQLAAAERRVWSHSAVVFGTAYAVLISTVYFVQLTLVGPRLARGQVEGIEMFLFVPFDSFLYAVDILGYSFMSV